MGARKDCDITRWGQFTDIKNIKEEMLTRLFNVFFKNEPEWQEFRS